MRGEEFDYEGIFARTMKLMIEEEFSSRGIDSVPEETLDELIAECVRQYMPIRAELRRVMGMSYAPKIRMRW